MSRSDPSEVVFKFVGKVAEKCGVGVTEAEEVVSLIYSLELEVSNGGLGQYFRNPAGNSWPETLSALRLIGATRLATIFASAIAAFPSATPARDQLTRNQQLATVGSQADSLLDELTSEYLGLYENDPDQDSYARMAAFLAQRHLD